MGGYYYTVAPMAVSGALAIFFVVLICAMIILGFVWKKWFPRIMRGKGKVKMPRGYWEKKKARALRDLYWDSGRSESPRTLVQDAEDQPQGSEKQVLYETSDSPQAPQQTDSPQPESFIIQGAELFSRVPIVPAGSTKSAKRSSVVPEPDYEMVHNEYMEQTIELGEEPLYEMKGVEIMTSRL